MSYKHTKTALCPNKALTLIPKGSDKLSIEVTQNEGPLFSLPTQGWEAAADSMIWTTSGPACTLRTTIR